MAVGAILGQRGIQSVNGVPSGVTGNVDLSAGNMTSGIDMNSQTLTGLTTPINNNDATSKKYVDDNINLASTTGLEAIRAAAPYNWLDNSDFTNLIAQAGIGGNHGSQAYAADRWVLNNGTVSYNAGTGLTLNGTIGQKIENPPKGNTSTFVGTSSGTAIISFTDGWVYISSSGGVIAWAALYEGTYTEQTMPEYHPKGYTSELLNCKKYFRVLSTGDYFSGVATSGNTTASFFIPHNQKMRENPTVTLSNNFSLVIYTQTGYSEAAPNTSPYGKPESVACYVNSDYMLNLQAVFAEPNVAEVNNTVIIVRIRTGTIYLNSDI